ncbi:MAG: glycoside hydrolase family 99-like domain-containing protein [Rhodocyclaceae bacterium]|nr:glycoside hydrolase family 99-like domain-containing protein [Rhodocyclaceae bacterium]
MLGETFSLGAVRTALPDVRRAIFFAPHPDDEIFGCAGALMVLQEMGVHLAVIIVTDGEGCGAEMPREELARLRRRESMEALRLLGLPAPNFWGLPDRGLWHQEDLPSRLREAIDEHAAELVALPWLGEIHPDHLALARAGISAAQDAPSVRWLLFYEISAPLVHPNLFLSLGVREEKKRRAIQCYSTQLQLQPYAERIIGLNSYRAYHLGAETRLAEAYELVERSEWRRLEKEMTQPLARYLSMIAHLEKTVLTQQAALSERERALERERHRVEWLGGRIRRLEETLTAVYASRSWRITAPLRRLGQLLRLLRALPAAAHRHGGVGNFALRIFLLLRREGWRGIVRRLRARLGYAPAFHLSYPQAQGDIPRPLAVPCYEPAKLLPTDLALPPQPRRIAVHLHLYYLDLFDECVAYLGNVPRPFDLYVSTSMSADAAALASRFRERLPHAGKIVVENTINRGRDLAPLIVQFGARLREYHIVAHFHTKKSPHDPALARWRQDVFDLLLGDAERIEKILRLIQEGVASVVYAEAPLAILEESHAWGANRAIAAEFLTRYAACSITDYPVIEFPRGSMFWASKDAVRKLLSLPLTYQDFPGEPLPPDGSLAHALERIVLILAEDAAGRPFRLHKGDSVPDYREYEEAQDFSSLLEECDVKVLAYYLPQFHPIPENDRWHGEGFTEWTKVRAANPLFFGHYQQHIPHPDIGYYRLEGPETLRKQALMARRAGVHGFVFYHYWFSGKLILEKPAQILLAHPDIDLPYCFCWANENWTRRWDGNESEVLLEQRYSQEDARAFMRYLLPFLRDPRYLRVAGRPMLFVYRPASLPREIDYPAIWREECRLAGLPEPYLVAVLTRGAVDPRHHGMDAGVERVLHDWTGGAVRDCKEALHAFRPLTGSVLSYDEVAAHYEKLDGQRTFDYFRSLVPNWDNTARYDGAAYLLHGSRPMRFQSWLHTLVEDARRRLPADRRFILINAWNEWAEGAHLEPDSRYGYAYLNAVGRALGDVPYPTLPAPKRSMSDLTLHLSWAQDILVSLHADTSLRTAWQQALVYFFAHKPLRLTADSSHFEVQDASAIGRPGRAEDADCILGVRRLAVPVPADAPWLWEGLVRLTESAIAIPLYADGDVWRPTENDSITAAEASAAAWVCQPRSVLQHGYRNIRAVPDMLAFPLPKRAASAPEVAVVVRFHEGGDWRFLEQAIASVLAMHDCRPRPLIALQCASAEKAQECERRIGQLAKVFAGEVRCEMYMPEEGCGDLRARMLNHSLTRVDARYVAFLDYDDLLFAHAYAYLLDRLRKSGKAVAFGRIYDTLADAATGRLIERRRTYEYGTSYADFLNCNHTPIHGFLLDLERLGTTSVVYFDDQCYLEDYFLTLQLFRADNADWEGLRDNFYIGDYRHFLGGNQTLAIADEKARRAVLASEAYRRCEARIDRLKEALARGEGAQILLNDVGARQIFLGQSLPHSGVIHA